MKPIINEGVFPTEAEVLAAVEAEAYGTENPGFCLACGEEASGCEPDARAYECECCGAHAVYGAAEVLLMGAFRKNSRGETR